MKRHQSLYPLSHDHHHGLVQARQLILAGANAGRDDLAVTAERFIEFWEGEMERHFREEEEILLPLVEKYAATDYALVGETLSQHAEIRRLVAALNEEITRGTGIDGGLLSRLGVAIRDHIRFEENEMFPLIEKSVPEEALWRMNERLTAGGGMQCPAPKSGSRRQGSNL